MPVSDCQVRDPRIRRTRKLLQEALSSLMQAASFDEISVQDITDAATVNRATFYDHYTDKYALLEAMVAAGFHGFLDERQLHYQAGCPNALRAIIRATCDFLAQVHAARSCERQTAFQPLMDAAIKGAIERLLLEGLRQATHASNTEPALMAATASAAITGGVKHWSSSAERTEVGLFVAHLADLVLPMLEPPFKAESPIAAEAHSHS